MKRFVLFPEESLDVWDNRPGGKVIRRYSEDGYKYVVVEFENSPGDEYLFLAP